MIRIIMAILVFVMFCGVGGSVFGQNQKGNNLIRFEEDGKYGYKNESGKIVIEPQFYGAGEFSEGLAPVEIQIDDLFENRWGYIDENGIMVINPLYGGADEFLHGLARVISVESDDEENYKYGLINKAGTLVVDTVYNILWIDYGSDWQYEAGSPYDKDVFKVIIDDKIGFVTINGLVGQQSYDHAYEFYLGKAAVSINGKWGFIDKTGKFLIEPQYDAFEGYLDDGNVVVEIAGKDIVIDQFGNHVMDSPYQPERE